MRNTLSSASTGVKVSFAVIALSIVVASAGVGALGTTLFLRWQGESELRRALVENCEDNGNPLREVLIEEQVAAIQDPHDPRLRRLFPDAPLPLAEQIIREANRAHRERISLLAPVDCAAQYGQP